MSMPECLACIRVDFRLAWLEGLPALRKLNLSNNPIENLILSEPVEERLVELDLSGEHGVAHWSSYRLARMSVKYGIGLVQQQTWR